MKRILPAAVMALTLLPGFVPRLAAASTVLPTLTNVWEQAHVYLIDKDTNSVFVNANERFIQSLQPAFPEIRTVADLAGKNDFYFYPTNLAEQYRADDQRVLQGGVPWETIEENQTLGQPSTFVYTLKTPLRDAQGGIYALRILFYSIPAPHQTVLPVFTNRWDLEHICVLDKNTNGVMINANEAFLMTLLPTFPEIKSVTNLIGKDDFYFYPTNLAAKYQADDHAVMLGGVPWDTIEENQPLGGAKTYVYVSKTPLKNAQNQIYALRIAFFSLPQLHARLQGGQVEVYWQDDGSPFVPQQTEALGFNAAWGPSGLTFTKQNGVSSLSFAPTNRQGFFRLRKN